MARIIGICGGTASGKSTIACRAAKELGAARVELDWFYHDHSSIPRTAEGHRNFDHPDSFEWPLVEDTLKRLWAEKQATAPRYAYDAGRMGTRTVAPTPLIVFEGILALHHPAVRALLDRAVFVDAPEEVRFARRMARDQQERNVPAEQIAHRLLHTVRPMHDRYVEPQRAHADLVLDGTDPLAHRVLLENIKKRSIPL